MSTTRATPRPAVRRLPAPRRAAAPRRGPAPPPSRARVFAAAAAEFARRGFEGATVDRIAARARLNKAMLYYHFPSKAALYREILQDMFGSVARAVAAVRAAGGPPDAQLCAFVDVVAREGQARPHFPPIWLREVAEGGPHLDAGVTGQLSAVLGTLGEIVADGRRAGLFRDVPPLLVQFGIVAPLLLFVASQPLRDRLSPRMPAGATTPPLAAAVAYVQAMTLAALAPSATSIPPARARAHEGTV